MNRRLTGSRSLKEILILVFSAFICTLIMSILDAYERLYLFTRLYKLYIFDEFAVFLPAFLAMGFVLFSIRRIQELQSEISRRETVEEALQESEKKYRKLSITDALTKLYNL